MHGVTKPVTLTGEVLGVVKDPTGKNPARAGFSFTGTINRKDFGIIWNKQLDQSTTLLGDEVALQLDVEATEKVAQAEAPKPGEPAPGRPAPSSQQGASFFGPDWPDRHGC